LQNFGQRLRPYRTAPLHHCFQVDFDFEESLLPFLMLRHFKFCMVFFREIQAILGSDLIKVAAKAGNLLR